jgi:hypothetical protein
MDQMTPCIETTGWRDRDGYGHCKRVRFGQQINLVHRLAWIDANGRLPAPGMNILHACDNPGCVNPEHLREGTQADNITDCIEHGRHPNLLQTHCKRGHLLPPPGPDGKRRCIPCQREKQREWDVRNGRRVA